MFKSLFYCAYPLHGMYSKDMPCPVCRHVSPLRSKILQWIAFSFAFVTSLK